MKLPMVLAISLLVLQLSACSASATGAPKEPATPRSITYGSETQRGFLTSSL